ncbi:F-box/LRR-repeat protein 15 [Nematostella vectensis]|uniref:F-box/LRR-repeat protein 15 n=1 Tax=Nematostella vectensis TaxID=45351 RepID=UPI002076EBEB|nr:F-box/LRR-repeat protein 15 [Nematostella vectensis]
MVTLSGPLIDSKMEDIVRSRAEFFDLPWEDVVFSHILSHLKLSQVFLLRRVCRTFHEMCSVYFKTSSSLDFSGETRLTSEALRIITRENISLQKLVLKNCKNPLKEDALKDILQRNPRLIVLDLSGCSTLTNLTSFTIAEFCPLLKEIRLSECRWVSPDGIIQVSLCCKDLEIVDLTGCWEITDHSVCSLASFCNKLKVILLNGCYSISDDSVRAIGRLCPSLTDLGLCGCWRVSNPAISHIGEYCSKLKFLAVKDCRDVTEASLARLRARGVEVDIAKPMGRYSGLLPLHMHHVPMPEYAHWNVPSFNLNT